METWKIIGAIAIAFVAVAFVTVTALAYMGGGQAAYNPYAPNSYTQGPNGGMMGGTYPNNGGYQYPNGYSQQSPYPQQYGQNGPMMNGGSGCH